MPGLLHIPNARWWALFVLALTELVVVLDATIVAVALPAAQLELGLSDLERQWVVNAYVLAFGSLLLLGGRIADFWGRKRTFMLGMVGFGLASVWGGLSVTGIELIIARGVQGAFAALLAPAALAMVTVTFTQGKERTLAFAIFGTVAGTGEAIGLLLGGVLTEFASWRWCLLVNVVFVIIGLLGGVLFLSNSRVDGRHRIDVGGALTITLGLASVVYGFSLAEHGWNNPGTIIFLALGVLLLVAFVWIEKRVSEPLLPLRIILHRARGGSFLIQAILGAVIVGTFLYITFYLQIALGLGPFLTGLVIVVSTVVDLACLPFATRALNRFGPRPLLILGSLICAAGLFALSLITPGGSYLTQVLPALILLGIGFSMLFAPIQNLSLIGVDAADAGVAAATSNAALNMGGSIGLAILTIIYATTESASRGSDLAVLTAGYSATFFASAVLMVVAAVLAFVLIRGSRDSLMAEPADTSV